jgi:hypothetical protein
VSCASTSFSICFTAKYVCRSDTFARKKDKEAQMMVAEPSAPMSVDNIQLNLKQRINIKGNKIRGCSLLPDSRMVLLCWGTNTISFINNEGVELFIDCKHVSCVSASFSICFTAKYVCRSDACFLMLTIFVWYLVSSF